MQKSKIEWCDYTWNPVTGCKRGCFYCYARRIHERFHITTLYSQIIYHAQRMSDPAKVKRPSAVFVGSMSDIEYWPRNITQMIINECEEISWHTFMFLTKNPKSYSGFDWPDNTMQGLTMELNQDKQTQSDRVSEMMKHYRPFISIEPLLGFLKTDISKFEKIIVGAMTGPGALEPKTEYIKSITDNVPNDKVFWKTNIKKYL